jgi:hypothetical protein
MRGILQQVDEHTDRDEERGNQNPYPDVRNCILRSGTPDSQGTVGQKAGQRQRDREPDE